MKLRWGLLAFAWATACQAQHNWSEPPADPDLRVRRGQIRERVLLTGNLDAIKSIDLVAPQTRNWNLTIRWLIEDGTRVEVGQPVLEFDTSELAQQLDERKVEAIRAAQDLDTTRAKSASDLAAKRIAIDRARAVRDKAALEAAIAPELQPRRVFQERQLALKKGESGLRLAEDALAAAEVAAELEIRVKRIALDRADREIELASDAIDALAVKAPQAGIAVIADHPWQGRKFQLGDNVWPDVAIVKLPDLSVMRVEARLADVDDAALAVGAAVTCRLDAYPERGFAGTVRAISPVAREPSPQSLRRHFLVSIDLEQTDPALMRPGMSVKVEAIVEHADVTIAPRAGLDLSASPPRARLLDGADVVVELGPCDAHACAVERGLPPDARLRPAAEDQTGGDA